ncbi:hypothetical protein IQ254_03550 [Nodosilinea sp. LEGE 07088]|uniref:hypothetical protein n=1 Tax=Nodosilinea sp. LEGE 07088 TaxID=2777968 RepID=UPI001881991A|nr:hypothetical protein [Nodosilinea sp. LEGE 07088]MBE9136285.1 hypothetical protein [Nodosilinea sp. LEGE 07088]
MSAPFRITRPAVKSVDTNAEKTAKEVKSYLERLLKLIPAEVISLYLVGKGMIAGGAVSQASIAYWGGWTVVCLVGVFIVRIFGTADPNPDKPEGQPQPPPQSPQMGAVLIACVSFLVWIYSMGDVFALLNLYEPILAGLIMLGWTFFVPFFYKGSRT